jgi:hypothetical protein
MPEGQKPKIRELVIRASSDAEFAQQVLSNPESVAAEYNLDAAQIEQIKELARQDIFQPAVELHTHISPPPYE